MSLNVLPPMTTAQLKDQLKDDLCTSYVFIGGENETGWKVAVAAEAMLSQLRVYRAKSKAPVKTWVGKKKGVRGLVFGWSDKTHSTLNKTDTADLATVIAANAEAAKRTQP